VPAEAAAEVEDLLAARDREPGEVDGQHVAALLSAMASA
jgi:hypothetical protein